MYFFVVDLMIPMEKVSIPLIFILTKHEGLQKEHPPLLRPHLHFQCKASGTTTICSHLARLGQGPISPYYPHMVMEWTAPNVCLQGSHILG